MYTQKLQGAELMYLALAAYATYVVNAGQFILKLRAARLDQEAKLRESAAVKHEGFQGMAA
jgi:3-vinyl bacteriochlorophyllide hydratase